MIAKHYALDSEGVLTTWWRLLMLCVDTARNCNVGHLAKSSYRSRDVMQNGVRNDDLRSAVQVQRSYNGGNGTACAEITT